MQWSMEKIAIDYFPNPFDPGSKETKYGFHSYISDENEQYACDSHDYTVYLLKIYQIRNFSFWHVNFMV